MLRSGTLQQLRRQSRLRAMQQGFTLIELLVAISVMALLAIISWRGLDGMVRSQEQTRQRADELMVVQTVLAQWSADLDALQVIEHAEPIDWDGQALRLTRQGPRQRDDGAVVVAWALRGGQWLRWQSPAVRTRAEWTQAWQRAAQWARTPGEAERRSETLLMPLQNWRLFYYRGGAWSNALSSGTSGAPGAAGTAGFTGTQPTAGAPTNASATTVPVPDGIRLQITPAPGSALSGDLTMDWVNPLTGGNKS
ncbi:type II secretion system protein J [Paracidovorax wautersii]|uniref:General secretion pathway protein J n=1 Tax=Paracidovorax wautersii TaxID=1177982 RepID=A0ABU1IB26_9BURK|nr:general secretion pathway protein J [Paracidovorax wautersii]